METKNQPEITPRPISTPDMTDTQMLLEIYENTRKTKNYMKWQLYITIILVVLPILASLLIIPMALKSMTATYGSVLQ